jgi:transcriptional regulator with GAF, ATPase, and Fis domain
MARLSAWFHFLVQGEHRPACTFADPLARVGVTTYPLDPDAPAGPGVVVFDQPTPRLCEFLRDVSHNGLRCVLALATGRSTLNGGRPWQLLQAGATDVFAWDHSATPEREVAARLERWQTVDQVVNSPLVRDTCVGHSPVWVRLLRQIVEVAYFTDASVLITGESGTGKEQVTRLIHALDRRPNKRDLVILDCTTVVRELAGSEFFGHERGAFTGAVAARDGAFALADGGTLFLDEVGELPPALQAELLRVVQERTFKRVGSHTWQTTQFRLVCATNRDLLGEVTRGRFRQDLYYRIANWSRQLPPLRERPEDILPLTCHFMRQLRPGQDPPDLDDTVRDYLLRRPYPGNVRDLKHTVARIMHRHVGPGPITAGDIPEDERPAADQESSDWCDEPFERAIRRALLLGVPLKEIGRVAESTAVRLAVRHEQGNLQRAAVRLGVTDRALQMRRAALRQASPGGDGGALRG